MARRKENTKKRPSSTPSMVGYTGRGIRTGADFIGLMGAVMDDLANGRITSHVANAMCNVGGKMLKCAELQLKHGRRTDLGRVLELAPILAPESESVQ